MLFASMLLMTVGYSMLYAALHGHWEFWRYLIPKNAPAASGSTTAAAATTAIDTAAAA